MLKRYYNNDLILHITLLMLCLAPVVLSFMLMTDGNATALRFEAPLSEVGAPCIFKAITGYNCPACGMTRCFIYMSRLNIHAAWRMNKAGVLLFIFCIFQVLYRTVLLVKTRIAVEKYFNIFQIVYLIIMGVIALTEFAVQFI